MRKKPSKKDIIMPIAVIAVLLAIVIFAGSVLDNQTINVKEDSAEDDNASIGQGVKLEYNGKQYRYNTDIDNYLVIGFDKSNTNEINKEDVEEGYIASMADTVMLLSLDSKKQIYSLIQLDRNTITKIPILYADGKKASTSKQQLCTAFYYGHDIESGSKNVADTVSKLLKNTPVDGYAAISMQNIKDINNIVGGVTVNVEDDFSAADPTIPMGQQITLTDEQSYNFVQARMNVGDGTNESRMRRQREYISGFKNKLIAKTNENSNFPNDVYNQLKTVMTTDISGNEVGILANALMNYQDNGIIKLDGETRTGQVLGDGQEHEEFYPNENNLMKTVISLFYIEQ